MQTALEERDAALRALNQPIDNDIASEAISHLDVVLITVMAAFDMSAGVAHKVLDLPGRLFDAGWQRGGWLETVAEVDPALAALVAADTVPGRLLFLISRLRNSIHSEALSPLSVGRSGGHADHFLVRLPPEIADQVVEAMNELGGEEAWGVQRILPGRIDVDPFVLV